MGAEIRIYSIGDSWTLLPGGHGFYVNNGNVNPTFEGWYEDV